MRRSAVHEVPRIILRKFDILAPSSDQSRGSAVLSITLSNPRLSQLCIRFLRIDDSGSIAGGEIAESDLGFACYNRRPPVVSVGEILELSSDSPAIELGSYEDELLIEDDTTQDANMVASETTDGWSAVVRHNVATISIPVELPSCSGSFDTPAAVRAELSFIMTVSANGSAAIIARYFTKILLAGDAY